MLNLLPQGPSPATMPVFRLYLISPDNRITRPPQEAECADDVTAVAMAKTLALTSSSAVEVWHGVRMVARVSRGE